MEEQEQPQLKKRNSVTTVSIIIALIVIAGIGVYAYQGGAKTPANTENKATPAITDKTQPTVAEKKVSYKDGTYTAIGDYTSPGGPEELGVTLTVKDGVITEATVEPKATRPNSVHFQGIFVDNYKPLVIGKDIDSVKLSKVSGSSLAPKGFNDAVEKIKMQAKA